jgi:hypothetical protein
MPLFFGTENRIEKILSELESDGAEQRRFFQKALARLRI